MERFFLGEFHEEGSLYTTSNLMRKFGMNVGLAEKCVDFGVFELNQVRAI